jgi:hypothetical protein
MPKKIDDLAITSRMLGVDLVGSRRIWPGRRTATLRALTSCRVAVVPDGVLDREVLAELAEGRRFRSAAAA